MPAAERHDVATFSACLVTFFVWLTLAPLVELENQEEELENQEEELWKRLFWSSKARCIL